MFGRPAAHLAGFLDWEDTQHAEGESQPSSRSYSWLWCELTHSLLTGRLGKAAHALPAVYVRLSSVEMVEVAAEARQLLLLLDGSRTVVLTAPDEDSFAAWRESLQRALMEHSLAGASSATPSPTRIGTISNTLLSSPHPAAASESEDAPVDGSSSRTPSSPHSNAGTSPPSRRRSESGPTVSANVTTPASPQRRRHRHRHRHPHRTRSRSTHRHRRQHRGPLAPPVLEDLSNSGTDLAPSFTFPEPPSHAAVPFCLAPPVECLADPIAAPPASPPPWVLAAHQPVGSAGSPIATESTAAPRSGSSPFTPPLADWRSRSPPDQRRRWPSPLRLSYGTDSRTTHWGRRREEVLWPRSRSSGTPEQRCGAHHHHHRELGPEDPLLCLCQPRHFIKRNAQGREARGRDGGAVAVYACLTLDGEHLVVIPADAFERHLRKAGMWSRRGDAPVALRSFSNAKHFFGERYCLAMPVANIRDVRVGPAEACARPPRGRRVAMLCFLSRSHALVLELEDTSEAVWLQEKWSQLLRRK